MKKYCDEVKVYINCITLGNFNDAFHKVRRSLVARGLNPRERVGLLDRAIVADYPREIATYIEKRERLDHADQAPSSLIREVESLEQQLKAFGLSNTKREYLERIIAVTAEERKRVSKGKSAKRRARSLAHEFDDSDEELVAIAADVEYEEFIQRVADDFGLSVEEAEKYVSEAYTPTAT